MGTLPYSCRGGGTIGKYKLYSCRRISYYFPYSIRLLPALPAGNIHRVIDERVSPGTVGSVPSVNYQACEEFFPVNTPENSFTVRYIYSTTKWQLRSLNLHELLRLKDSPESIISSLSTRHRRLLWYWNGGPLRSYFRITIAISNRFNRG